MYVVITGSVASGKTTIANELKRKISQPRFIVINDKEFAIEHKLGEFNKTTHEYEVDTVLFSRKVSEFIKTKRNVIFEGHLFCELQKFLLMKINFIFVLKPSEKFLRDAMKERGYDILKIEENILCYKTDYFEEKLKKKNIDFITIQTTKDLKLNVNKINKYLKL